MSQRCWQSLSGLFLTWFSSVTEKVTVWCNLLWTLMTAYSNLAGDCVNSFCLHKIFPFNWQFDLVNKVALESWKITYPLSSFLFIAQSMLGYQSSSLLLNSLKRVGGHFSIATNVQARGQRLHYCAKWKARCVLSLKAKLEEYFTK